MEKVSRVVEKSEQVKRSVISVIVPVFNAEKYLVRCLESIIGQSYHKLEIILIDDGSTDQSGKICDAYARKDGRITVVHKKNEGVSAARNAGLKISTGQYVCFVDADDEILEEYINYLYQLIKITNADISCCNYVKVNSRDSYRKERKEKVIEFSKLEAMEDMIYKKHLSGYCCLKLFRSNLVKGEIFNEQLKVAEDFEFMLHILSKADKICYTSKILYLYSQNQDSCMHDKNWKKYYDAWEQLKTLSVNWIKKYPDLRHAFSTYLFIAGLDFYIRLKNQKATKQCVDEIERYLKSNRRCVLKNRKGKWTHRVMALLCCFRIDLLGVFLGGSQRIMNRCNIHLRKAI